MAPKGKKLENDVKKYLKDKGTFHHKLHDSHSARGLIAPVPSDFIIFSDVGPAILLECKETQKLKLPLTAFRPSQLKAMRSSLDLESVNYYVIIKGTEGYFLVHGDEIVDLLDSDESSIDLEKCYWGFKDMNGILHMMFEDNLL